MSIDQKLGYFWTPSERGNFVAVKFTTPSKERVDTSFASAPGSDKIDRELVAHFKTLVMGDAIEINFKDSGLKTERSLKVNVNKMAKLAKRHLDWRTVDGNFIARVDGYYDANDNVSTDNPDTVTANGTTTSEVTVVDTPLQEASRSRNR
jgi:hypothetical protein